MIRSSCNPKHNPSGSFKDNGMATALTHAKLLKVKRLVCASTGNTSASAAMTVNEDMECDVYVPKGKLPQGSWARHFSLECK